MGRKRYGFFNNTSYLKYRTTISFMIIWNFGGYLVYRLMVNHYRNDPYTNTENKTDGQIFADCLRTMAIADNKVKHTEIKGLSEIKTTKHSSVEEFNAAMDKRYIELALEENTSKLKEDLRY